MKFYYNKKTNIYRTIQFLIMLKLGLLIILTYACEKKEEIVPKERSVKVIILGDANIDMPCPVELKGVTIGKAVTKSLDKRGRPIITIVISEKNIIYLKDLSVFWINNDERGTYLIYEILRDDSPPKKGELVFIGFSSYSKFQVWRIKNVAKKGFAEVMNVVNSFLENLSYSKK